MKKYLTKILKNFGINEKIILIIEENFLLSLKKIVDIRSRFNLLPIVVFGWESKKKIKNLPEFLIFEKRKSEYLYIEFPFSLPEFINKIQFLTPLINNETAKEHIKKYFNKNEILSIYNHSLFNIASKKNTSENDFLEILKKMLIILKNKDNLILYIEKNYERKNKNEIIEIIKKKL